MKKLAVLAFAVALLFSGCAENDPQIDPDMIKIEITYSGSENITFDVINNYAHDIETGADYFMEYYDGESWIPLDEKTEAYFNMVANVIAPGEKMNFSYDINSRYGKLSDGKYRLVKDINLLNDDGVICGSQRIYAEFEVSVKER